MLNELIAAVDKTQEVDEGGDATLFDYLQESEQNESTTLVQFLEGYLVWANGPSWRTWLPTAKPGDIPPK